MIPKYQPDCTGYAKKQRKHKKKPNIISYCIFRSSGLLTGELLFSFPKPTNAQRTVYGQWERAKHISDTGHVL